MRFIFMVVVLILASSASGANFIEQTDWAGGPGVQGPVLSWENYFDTSTDIDWSSSPGELLLQETTPEDSKHSSKGYETIGSLISSILEMPADTRDDEFWGNIFWDAGLPPGTEVSFRIRGSDDAGNMGSWSDPIMEWGKNISDILDEEFAYFQYEATLATSNTSITPELFSIVVTFEVDSGGFWVPGISGTNESLNDVCFIDPFRGWAVGNNGVILTTFNGGESWEYRPSGTTKNLNSVSFADEANGWVAGAGGLILSTEDGGDVWNSQISGVAGELNGISFNNENSGWAVGAGETILATYNGGSSWEQRHSGSGVLNGVHCADNMNVTVIGNGGLILGSVDSGDVWTPQTSGVTENLNDVFMATPNIIYAVGDWGTIINSSDGGQTWILQQQDTLPTSDTVYDLMSVDFVNSFTGWAVGTAGVILYSESGGEKWILQPGNKADESLLGISAVSEEHAVSSGFNGTVLLYDAATGIEDDPVEPGTGMEIMLYPNPFRSSTKIRFTLETSASVEITVIDLSGRIVNRIFSGEKASGHHSIEFAGRNQSGDLLPSGVYLCVLRSGEKTVSSPMVLIR
ncbi:MAG: T9SS type A sorting domain-containing protein [Candidatus Sabulitectum sp.]|nr:T9SS type A sorting domain-containing protein [Candidatus Sabulitectum sp.]